SLLESDGLLGKTEVEQLDALPGNQNVGGLQIAMDNALFVRGIEGVENLPRVLDSPQQRQRSFEGLALDKLHDQIVRSHIVELADVRMIECGNGTCFLLEALTELDLRYFHCDGTVEAGIPRLPDLAHAARADWREYFVG